MLLELLIINKSGGVIYSRNLSQGSSLSDNDYLRLGSTFHSLHAITTQVAPTKSSGIEYIDSDGCKLYCFSSKTGIKIVIISITNINDVDGLLQGLYEIYADFVMKNPFYEIDMPIRLEMFNHAIDKLVSKINIGTHRKRST